VIEVVNQWDGSRQTFKGLDGVRECFEGFFGYMTDISDLAAPVVNVQEATSDIAGNVLLIWKVPASGVMDATDTFVFDKAQPSKILRQNVVLYREDPAGKGVAAEESPPLNGGVVLEGWKNHFSAFAGQDVPKVLMDYTENSVIHLYNEFSGELIKYEGLVGVEQCFTDMFKNMPCLTDVAAPIQHLEEIDDGGVLLLIWRVPCSGYKRATDTFIFDKNGKILMQNIVVRQEQLEAESSTSVAKAIKFFALEDLHVKAAPLFPIGFVMAAFFVWRGRRTSAPQLERSIADQGVELGQC